MNGRELLAQCVTVPAVLDAIGDADDLREAGLNSGEIVLLIMRLEDEVDRALEDEEITSVSTIAGIDALLATAGPPDASARDAA